MTLRAWAPSDTGGGDTWRQMMVIVFTKSISTLLNGGASTGCNSVRLMEQAGWEEELMEQECTGKKLWFTA